MLVGVRWGCRRASERAGRSDGDTPPQVLEYVRTQLQDVEGFTAALVKGDDLLSVRRPLLRPASAVQAPPGARPRAPARGRGGAGRSMSRSRVAWR